MDIILPTWLGSYYGAELSFHELELRTLTTYIEPLRKLDIPLYEHKWFDYVRLHPLQATYYFVDCYRKLYQRASKQFFGKTTQGFRELDFIEGRERLSFWRARLAADSIGVPYPWFISKIFEGKLESGLFKNRLPRPCHLVESGDLEVLKEMWNLEHNGSVLTMAADPFYNVKRWVGDAAQVRHEDFLIEQVRKRSMKRFALATLIYEKQVLRIERAIKEFPKEIADAQREAESFTPKK